MPSGKTVGWVREALRGLDLSACSEAEVVEAIGNNSWVSLTCDECGEDVERVVRVGAQEDDYDERWQELCAGCVARAEGMLVCVSAGGAR